MVPPMPATMRNDVKPKRTQVLKPTGRYFAGKEDDDPISEDEEEEISIPQEPEPEPQPQAPKLNLKVDLQAYYERERKIDAERRALEQVEVQEKEVSSEYETEEESSSEEQEPERPRVLHRPTFLTKAQRETLKTAPSSIDESEKRHREARQLIEAEIRHQALQKEQKVEEVDDTDLNDEAEHQAWKLRELLRIKRDREAIEKRELEREEIQKRREMPELERLREDQALVDAQQREKSELRATEQRSGKYHHVGAFYTDDSVVQRSKRLSGTIEDTGSQHGLRGATRWKGMREQDTSEPKRRKT